MIVDAIPRCSRVVVLSIVCKCFIFLVLSLFVLSSRAVASGYEIGVYYYPGWYTRYDGVRPITQWDKIRQFPERMPLIGWYPEGSVQVMEGQIAQMHEYGLSFVAFDWYYRPGRKIQLDHAISAFINSNNKGLMKFSVLWANHDKMPTSLGDWDQMVQYWIDNYFEDPQYYRIENKPVVFVFSADQLETDARKFSSSAAILLSRAQAAAHAAGLPGIYFIGCVSGSAPLVSRFAAGSGYSAFSAYNYHAAPDSRIQSHSYAELVSDYEVHWQKFAEAQKLPIVLPLTAGWDHRPLGPSGDPLHDLSRGTPEQFLSHLMRAKSFLDSHKHLTHGAAVICCWNEYGEGSYIEPAFGTGYTYLEKIRSVFGGP